MSAAIPVRDTLAAARALWMRGFSVIPVPRPRHRAPVGVPGDGKVPAIAWGEFQTRLASDAELAAWFATDQNIAVITGAMSKVVVVDADSRDALQWCVRRLPYTCWQTKTARGFHLWYGHPGVRVPNRARIDTGSGRLAIDVRGDGGFVSAPGSLHASGVWYEQAGDWDLPRAELPRFWPGWLERPSPAVTPMQSRPLARHTDAVIDGARRYLAAIPPPEIGRASDADTFYAASRMVRGFGLSCAEAEDLLWEWAGGRPGWTRDWINCKVSNADRYGTEAVGALR